VRRYQPVAVTGTNGRSLIRAISQSSDRVQVEFTKNSPREFALVIGADGLHSNVRAIAFGDESRFVRDLGLYLCVYTVPNYLKLDRMEMQYSELGRVAAIWSSRGDADAKACFGFVAPSVIDLRNRARQQQVLTSVYQGMCWPENWLRHRMPIKPHFSNMKRRCVLSLRSTRHSVSNLRT